MEVEEGVGCTGETLGRSRGGVGRVGPLFLNSQPETPVLDEVYSLPTGASFPRWDSDTQENGFT